MPKPTEADREGYCLWRIVPRHLTQYDSRLMRRSQLLQFVRRRTGGTPNRTIDLVKVCALAHGAGVTSKWPYTRYNCYFRLSATNRSASPPVPARLSLRHAVRHPASMLMPVLEGRTTTSRDIRSWPDPHRMVLCFAAWVRTGTFEAIARRQGICSRGAQHPTSL